MELTKEWVKKRLPVRPKDANKGTFGKVLGLAGSKNYLGAAFLACAACYRAGAGLVTLVAEESVKVMVFKKLPEITFLSPDEVADKISKYDVLMIGPGLGQSDQVIKLVKLLLNNSQSKVIDGDGLNILADTEWFGEIKGKAVFTPHPGEMARLTSLSVEEIQKDRLNIAKKFAEEWGQVVVLKGANTMIASPRPEEEILVSPFANPALATAGTGDVLAGVISGLLAQGLTPYEAAGVGVYIHGVAGEMLRKKFGEAGGLASDLLPLIPLAIKSLV